jgi:DNA repair protein RadC
MNHPLAAYCRKSVLQQLPTDPAQILSLTVDDLQRAGCNPAEIRRIVSAQALAHHANTWTLSDSTRQHTPRRIATWIAANLPHLRFSAQEELWLIVCDTKMAVVSSRLITKGTIGNSLIHPREFYRPAIQSSAVAVFSVHNHPSGCLTPSEVDFSAWDRLTAAGETLGIPCNDHFICSRTGIYSRAEQSTILTYG